MTDHNVFVGAVEVADLARGRDIAVIRGEEVKTDTQGEVIGLFLHEEIPRGLTFGDTIAAIKEQGGIVYLPHPFDRMHAIPDPITLHRHLAPARPRHDSGPRVERDASLRFASLALSRQACPVPTPRRQLGREHLNTAA